jgi:hypothetical protein
MTGNLVLSPQRQHRAVPSPLGLGTNEEAVATAGLLDQAEITVSSSRTTGSTADDASGDLIAAGLLRFRRGQSGERSSRRT